MKRSADDLPERLRTDGTRLERRLLDAVAGEEPSPELSRRMAAALGISATCIGTAASGSAVGKAAASGFAGTKAVVGKAGATVLWPWLSVAVLAVAVAGAVVARRAGESTAAHVHSAPSAVRTPPTPRIPAETPKNASGEAPKTAAQGPGVVAPAAVGRKAGPPTGELRDQIALVDAARTAVTAGSSEHALELLRRYQDKYPSGAFRPEAAALRIEALVKLGRMAEARSLAERFVAEYAESPLAERVAQLARLSRP